MSEVRPTDLVSRLRAYDKHNHRGQYAVLCREAADEIEKLRSALDPFARAGVKGDSRQRAFKQAGFCVMECNSVFIHTAKTFLSEHDFRVAAERLEYTLE